MDGNGEGMVAVVQGLRDAGLAVTLMSKRCASQERKVARILAYNNQSLLHTKSSVETNTHNGYDRCHAGVQICDDRYASSYQMAHCRMSPTSPPIRLSEFPPQRSQPNRTQGHFEIGGIGSGELTHNPIRTQYSFRSSLRWAERRPVQFSRASCQTDPFVHSLRRYPGLPSGRSISADLIERLIKHTQGKSVTKPSKTSKSMRSIPKDKSDEHTNRRERRSKNIQTYTRTKNEDRSNERESYVRKERSLKLSFSGERKHRKNKDSPINTTYDYFKGSSSLYRKRRDRFTDVRYLDNLTKYIKDTLQQICDDKPVMCPNIQSRYHQHRKNFHHEQSSHESYDADDQAEPSDSQGSPSTSLEPRPVTCRKDCPKGSKICDLCRKPLACPCVKNPQTEAATSSPSLPTASKFCQCLPENIAPGKRKNSKDQASVCLCLPDSVDQTRPGFDQKLLDSEKSLGYDQKVNDEVLDWIRALPVKAGDTPANVAVRERIGRELADALKNIPRGDDYDDNVINEVKKYLDKLPIWLPDNKAAQEAFKDLMANNLLDKLKKIPDQSSHLADTIKKMVKDIDLNDQFANTIEKWVNDIHFKKDFDKDKIASDFINKLRPIALNRPKNNDDYAKILKEAICEMLEDLPLDNKGDKQEMINDLADKLVETLVSLPDLPENATVSLSDLPKKADRFADTVKEWVNGMKFKREIDKNQVARDFINKLKPIALNRPENKYEYAQKLNDAIKDLLEVLPLDIKGDKENEVKELANKLIDQLVSLPKDAVTPEDIVKPLNEVVDIINDWLDEDFPFMKDSKAVEDLAKKLRELQAKGVDENVIQEMRNVIQDFLKNVLDIKDPETLDRLTNKLLRQFLGDDIMTTSITPPKNREEEVEKIYQDVYNWMKNRPELSHLDPEKIKELSRELANKIYDNKIAGNEEINMSDWLKRKLSDIGEGQTVQEEERKRKLVLNEIDDFLAAATTDLPSEVKQELEGKLADMLIKNVDEIINYEVDDDLLEDETDRLIDKLFEGVKNIYAPDQPEIKVKIPKETKNTLQEEIDSILGNTTADIKGKDALKTNLINTLVEGIRKGENENELKKEIYDELRAANLSEDEAKKIAQNLFDRAKDMTLALRSQDSRMNHKRRLSKAEPSKLRKSINYQQEDNIFVPNDVLKLDKKKRGGSNAGVDAANKLENTKQHDDPIPQELLQQMKKYNIDPNDKEAVARFKNALQESKQGKRPLDKLIASIEKYSNLPKVPRKDKSKVSSAPEYTPSLTTSYSGVQNELINTSSGSRGPSLSSDEDARSKAKAQIKREPEDKVRQLSEERRKKLDRIDDADEDKKRRSKVSSDGIVGSVGSSMKNRPGSPSRSGSMGPAKRDSLDSKTKQEIKQSLKGGVHDILDNAKIYVNDREDLESKLNNLLNRLAVGDVDDVTDDVYKLLRNANIPEKQARDITNKLLNKTQSMSEAATQKIKAGPLKGRSLDSKTKQEITQTVSDHIKDVLDNINAEIDDRDDLEVKLNTLLNKLVVGARDDLKDDVYKLLRKANIPGEEAKPVTSRLIDKAKDLSESIAQKLKARPSKSRPLDAKTKEEIKQSLKGDIEKALDKVKTKIDDRENLESNLLNTILDQVDRGDVDAVRDDVFKLLRKSKIPGEESKTITNTLMSKANNLSEVVAEKTKAGPSRKLLDSKTKENIKQSLKGDIQKALDKVKTKINDRDNLESNLLNTILDQVEGGDVEEIRDDVHKLLHNANIHPEEAKRITNKLISKAKDLSEVADQKTKAELSGKPLDSKTKGEIKQSLKGDIEKALNNVKTKIEDRENLESNLLNTILDQVEGGDVEDVRDDVYTMLRDANISREEGKNITNKLIGKAKDLSEVVAQKTKAGPSGKPLDSKTKEELKQSIKGDIEKALNNVKTKIDDRENLESNLLKPILDQVEGGDVEDVRDDVYTMLRDANISREEGKIITNKLIGKAKDLSEVVAQKTKAGPSRKPLDSKAKEDIKQSLKGDIQKTLDKVKTKIDDRENLESNLLNTILDQVDGGDVEEIRNDVHKLLRKANIHPEEAKMITNKLISKAKDLSEVGDQKTKSESSRKPLDFKTKEEIKQSLKGDIEKALNKVKTKIDGRENLESNLLNTILDQVEGGDVEDVRDDVFEMLRDANIPREEAKTITNKLIGKGRDLSDVVDQSIKSRSETDDDSFEDKPGKAYAQKRRPDHLTEDKHTKMGRISSKEKDALRESIIGDVNDIVDGAPLPLSSRTKNVLKAKLSSALMKGLDAPYSKEEVKNKVLNILSEESIKLQGDGRPRTSSEKVGQKAARKKDSTGGIKIAHASILQEISTALQDARTKISKTKRHNLRNKLADIIISNLKSDLNNIRKKIVDLLTKETYLHRGVISDLSINIIERIIDVIRACEIANRRKTKNMIYSVQIGGKKREGKRKNNGNASSDEDGPISRSKSTVKHDSSNYSNFSKSISDNIDYTIAKEHINIPEHKITEIKQKLEKLSPKDILAMIRGDKAIKNKILDIITNEIKLDVSDANELINGVIKRFSENDDSQFSATSSQMQDMKGYLKGEILGLLEKYNVKFNQEGTSMAGSISPSLRSEAPLTSTPKDGVESPQMINEPSLSTVYGVDDTSEYTLKPSDRINSAEYYNKVLEVVDDWVEELPVDLNDENYRAMIVKELAADIIERQKYLQLNPDSETSIKEELECLKYQVFRWMNNLFDVGDLTPMTPKIERLRERINDINIPLFDKSSKRHRGKNITENNKRTEKNNSTEYNNTTENNNIRNSNGKERTSDAFIDKFEDWVESLPTKFKNEEEKQQYENLKSELLIRLKELGPNASPQTIQNEINKFLRKAPLDPSKKIDLDDKIGELTGIVQTTQPSKMEAASFESKTGYKKLPNLLYDFIENWCDSLPFDDSLDQDTIKNMKHSLANKILQKICQLNLNPEFLNDDFLYEDVLRDEIDNLLSEIRNYIPIDDEQLAEFKVVLINKIKEAKLKTQNELTGLMYKQQLRDAVCRTLPPGLDLTSEDLISFEMLKDTVADAFINLNYSSNNEELRNKLSKKIADEVTRFCNSYLQRHPLAPLCSNKLNQDLYAALNNVSLPNDESMRSEVEHVRMKEVITDWVRGLPLAEQTPTGQSTLNKMISVLAKRLHDLENAAELSDSDHTEEMKKEIKKWLRKLPLLGGKDSIDHYAADLIDRLKNTEDSRKFDASTRLHLDAAEICSKACHYTIKERPKTSKPCPDTCMFTPKFPSSLTREDREHLDRIRERVNQAKSKLAKRPCRDASPSPCMDTGSQTDIRPFSAMKSIPSVCPGTFQRPYKSAASRLRESPSCHVSGGTPRPEKPPCPGMYASPQARQCRRRSDAASPCVETFSPCNASYSDVQPQIIVKEYYWDSNGNSNHQIPCRSPCDTFPGSRDPRSPCSQPTPPCRGQYSQPHTVPQSPQISSSDQENRRPSPAPGTSRCYKERVTRLGSLDDVTGQNFKDKLSENLDWNSVRFPEDDDFWGTCSRPIILSDDDFGPFSRERERKEERLRCRCRERVLTKCATKRRNRLCGSCNPSNNDPTKRCCTKTNPVQCPHPSYLYFRK